MRSLDAQLAGAASDIHGPQIEGQPIAIASWLGEIHREVHRGSEDLFVVKQSRSAGCETVLEPILDEVTDHLEVARIEHPACRIAVPESDQNLALECGHQRVLGTPFADWQLNRFGLPCGNRLPRPAKSCRTARSASHPPPAP